MASDKVSIIIPSYNYAKYLPETLESCLAQTIPCEIIVVDDGSTDNTREVVKKYKKVKYFYKENTKKAAIARNYGVARSKGKYILPVDADDILDPRYVELALKAFREHYDIDIVSCNTQCFEGTNVVLWSSPLDERITQTNTLLYCSMVTRKAWDAVGGMDEDIPYSGWEDWTLWIKLYKAGFKSYNLDRILFHYRVHYDSMTFQTLNPHIVELSLWMKEKEYV